MYARINDFFGIGNSSSRSQREAAAYLMCRHHMYAFLYFGIHQIQITPTVMPCRSRSDGCRMRRPNRRNRIENTKENVLNFDKIPTVFPASRNLIARKPVLHSLTERPCRRSSTRKAKHIEPKLGNFRQAAVKFGAYIVGKICLHPLNHVFLYIYLLKAITKGLYFFSL